MTSTEILTRLGIENNDNVILIGSRAFNANEEFSDFDFVIKESELPLNLLMEDKLKTEDYFNCLPMGNSFLIRKTLLFEETISYDVDLLIYQENDDFDIVKKVITELKQLPLFYLEKKSNRVSLFETGLVKYGFIKNKVR